MTAKHSCALGDVSLKHTPGAGLAIRTGSNSAPAKLLFELGVQVINSMIASVIFH